MMSTATRSAFAIAAASLLAAGPLAAEERRHAPNLPGVEEGYRIVDDNALDVIPEPGKISDGPGNYRVGNWDVTISGSVSFQIGTGMPLNRR